MGEVTFGLTSNFPFTTSAGWVRMAIGVPQGRICANGQGPVIITELLTYTAGRSGTINITTSFAGSAVAYSVASSGTPGGTWRDSSDALVANGGTFTFEHSSSGGMNGRRGADGSGGFTDGQFGDWNSYWAGGFRYVEAPSAPLSLSVTSPTTGQIAVSWSAPADNGGTAVTGYQVQYATNAGFTGATTVSNADTDITINVTPGLTYYVRVAAVNAVATAAGTYGPWSSTGSVLVLSGVRVGVAGVWKDAEVYAGVNGVWEPVAVKVGQTGSWVGLE